MTIAKASFFSESQKPQPAELPPVEHPTKVDSRVADGFLLLEPSNILPK